MSSISRLYSPACTFPCQHFTCVLAGARRMTRGRRGSLLLRRRTPSFLAPCRFIPAHLPPGPPIPGLRRRFFHTPSDLDVFGLTPLLGGRAGGSSSTSSSAATSSPTDRASTSVSATSSTTLAWPARWTGKRSSIGPAASAHCRTGAMLPELWRAVRVRDEHRPRLRGLHRGQVPEVRRLSG